MKMEMIQKIIKNRETKQHILKVQPLNKLMIHIKEKKMSLLKKIHGFSECGK